MKAETETVYGVSGAHGYTLRFNVVNECESAFDQIIQSCREARERLAQKRLASPPPDECHHCGAPSPGDACRYCNTVHREEDPRRCPLCHAEYTLCARSMDNFGERPLIAQTCECATAKVFEVSRLGALRYLRTVDRFTGDPVT